MKYFLFNHSGCSNHGCEAIVRGTVNIISNSDSESKFVLSSYNPESDGIIGIDVNKFGARELTKTELVRAKLELKLRGSEEFALSRMYSPVIEQASDCDICLSVGGDTYCYGDNHAVRVITEELKKAGKKVVLWGASIGEEDLTDDKLENLRTFDAVFARESLTYDLLKDKKANDNIFLHADPAFCMEREDVNLPDGFTRENVLGINISPLIEKHNPKITQAAEDFVQYIIENTTLNVMFVPHVVEPDNNDYEYMLPLFRKFEKSGRTAILPPDLNAMQYKGYIAKLRFFIGARTHSTIAAYSSGVPTFVLGYSVKSRGIAKDLFGNEDYVADVKTVESEADLIRALGILLRDEKQIKETLKRKIPLQLRSAMQMGEILTKI